MPTRGDRLRLAAGLLSAPSEEALPALGELAGTYPWLAEAHDELAALALEAWQEEHGRLFINGFPHTPCLPFESAQVDGLIPGPSTAAVAALYAELGLAAEDEVAPDFLGVMLECAAWLGETGEAPDVEHCLWHDHLLRWLPGYAGKLQAESRLSLYRSLGRELAELCREAPDA